MLTFVLLVQGTYYLITGIWPLVHMPSFVVVTGPKTDLWLVRMVAALAVAIGLALLVATRESYHPSTALLGIGAAIAFLAVDLIYVIRKTVRPIYLGDAFVEIFVLGGWALALLARK